MTQAAARSLETESAAALPEVPGGLKLRAARFWIQSLVALSHRAPSVARAIRGPGVWIAWRCSASMRGATRANAARILGSGANERDVARIARGMVASFYDFLTDMGRHQGRDAESLRSEIESAQGVENYFEARKAGKGAIVVTAHIGSFEVGAAAMRKTESHVHVVFQRDPMRLFESLRAEQHRALGLIEAPVEPGRGDDTWNVWLKLRDALRENHVVLLQGDRVMPGQRGRKVPFMGGHVMLPPGPVKLAMATGAPIIPVCSPRLPDGRVRIVMGEPIWVGEEDGEGTHGGPHPAELQLAKVIEGWVRAYPEQWMMVQRVWCEDGR